MRDYGKGKIYTIRCLTNDTLIYVGSTIQTLSKRWGGHKRDSKTEENKNMLIYRTINEDWSNWKIELLLRNICPTIFLHVIYPQESIFNYRSVIHGNWNNDNWPGYLTKNNTFANTNELSCHATKEELIWADSLKLNSRGVIMLTSKFN